MSLQSEARLLLIVCSAGARLVLARVLLGPALRRGPLQVVVQRLAAPLPRPRDVVAERRAARLAALLWRRSSATCLRRSVALHHVLGRLGADPELVIGFRSDAGRVHGHAWVVVDGRPVLERADPADAFTPVLRFDPCGRRVAVAEGPRDGAR